MSVDDPLSAIAWIQRKAIDLVINIPEGTTKRDEVYIILLYTEYVYVYYTDVVKYLQCLCTVKSSTIIVL